MHRYWSMCWKGSIVMQVKGGERAHAHSGTDLLRSTRAMCMSSVGMRAGTAASEVPGVLCQGQGHSDSRSSEVTCEVWTKRRYDTGSTAIDDDRQPFRRLAARTRRHITRRLMPFLFVLYVFNYLNRVNVGYAALQMSGDLGFSNTVFGFGAGIFFIGYFLLQIPSTLVTELGARESSSR